MNDLPATMNLPVTNDQFFDVFGAYNQPLWPFALGLWISAVLGVAILARHRNGGRFITILLAVQWVWAAVAYHVMFFARINPAAWFFSVLSWLRVDCWSGPVALADHLIAQIGERVGPAPGGADVVLDFVGSGPTLEVARSVFTAGGDIAIVGLAGGALPVGFGVLAFEVCVTIPFWARKRSVQAESARMSNGSR
jgi:Family of unknown function (DUF6064)